MGEGRVYDFTSGGNPEGTPLEIRQAVRAAADLCDMRPEDMEADLEQAISRWLGIPAEHVCCGGGTASLIYRIIFAFRPRKALVPVPAWPLYETALKQYGCEVTECVLPEEDQFRPGASLREMIRGGGYDLLFLANPADPAGTLIDKANLTDLIYTCRKAGTRIVIDEYHMDLVMGQEKYTLLEEVARMNHVILLRSFSASFCMSGLRLGYALCGSVEDALCLRQAANDRTVSVTAWKAAEAALGCREISDESRSRIALERDRMAASILETGLKVYPSRGAFLLFQSPWEVGAPLSAFGIRLKEVTGMPGLAHLSGHFYRVAVRAPEENRYLQECLDYVVAAQRRTMPKSESKEIL